MTKKPNLIYVFADQLRYQSVGYAGDEKAHTPNIDHFASESVNFMNAVSSTPVCAPYRASLFTGKYTSSTGMVINELRINPHHRCFAHVLNNHGYEVGYIGKWHLWAAQAGHHHDLQNAYVPPGPHRLGFEGYWAGYNFHHEYYGAYYYGDDPQKIELDQYEPDAQTDLAIEYIQKRAKRDKPFALFLSWGPPHDPWQKDNVPEEFYNMFREVEFTLPPNWRDTPDPYMDQNTDPNRWLSYWKQNIPEFLRVYYAMNANLDWNFGRLLQAIEQVGIADDTIVVFTSDHGEMFGANGRVNKLIFYEEACRVPFLVRWPGQIPAGHISDACLGTPDIMPTLLSLMGLPYPDEVEGTDLSDVALGKDGPEPEAAFLQGMGHTFLWKNGSEWRGLRDKQFTYAMYRVDQSECLFDHQNDPLQLTNLINDPKYAPILERFRTMLKSKMTELNDTFEKCTWYRDHWIEDRKIMRAAKGKF